MAHFLTNPPHQNYYIKNMIAYTEDHVPVQKLYFYKVSPQLNQSILEHHFEAYGRVLRMQIFKPRKFSRGGGERNENQFYLTGFVLYAQKQDAAKALFNRAHRIDGWIFFVQASHSWHQPEAFGKPHHDSLCMLPSDKPAPSSTIMSLDDYCLENILQYLSLVDQIHFARSCLRFRCVYQAASARLHKSVNFWQLNGMTVWNMRDFFLLSGRHIQNVEGMLSPIRSQRLCNSLAHNCTNLKTMDLVSSPITTRNINKIFAKMHKLETLKLRMSCIQDMCILGLRNLRSLKTLNLSGNPLQGINLAKLPATIESLTLNDCQYFQGSYLSNICKSFPHLKELNVKNIYISCDVYRKIINEKSCPLLETVVMTAHDEENYQFVAKLPGLKYLTVFISLPNVNPMTNELFEQLSEHKAEQLERLEIIGGTKLDRNMLHLISKLVGLRTLVISRIVADDGLDRLSGLSKLERFTLRFSGNVRETAILKLFSTCRKLCFLGLESTFFESNNVLMDIVNKVCQERANREIQRELPIQLTTFFPSNNIKRFIEAHPDKVPKDIIRIVPTTAHEYEYDWINLDYADDPDVDLYENSDDDFEHLSDQDFLDMGFLSDDDKESDFDPVP